MEEDEVSLRLWPGSQREIEEGIPKKNHHEKSSIEIVQNQNDRHEKTYLSVDLVIWYPVCFDEINNHDSKSNNANCKNCDLD